MLPVLTEIALAGTLLQAGCEGALFWPERGWLMLADLHLEKGSAYARRGQLLPPYDTAATLTRVETLCQRLRPTRVLCLGDSFHDGDAAARVSGPDGRRIAALTQAHDWVWIAGNHDPAPPPGWGGQVMEELAAGPLTLRHAAIAGSAMGELSGHYHPKAATIVRGQRITGRCFVSDGHRLILPAFGAYAGGLNVLDPAISCLMHRPFNVWMVGRDRLHALPATRLAGDAGVRRSLASARA